MADQRGQDGGRRCRGPLQQSFELTDGTGNEDFLQFQFHLDAEGVGLAVHSVACWLRRKIRVLSRCRRSAAISVE